MATLESLPPYVIYGASEILEVMQNVRTILTTQKGTSPLDREFGLTAEYLDDPMPQARAKANSEIFLAIQKYEPRAVLKEITWDVDVQSGKFKPNVKIEVVNNVIF